MPAPHGSSSGDGVMFRVPGAGAGRSAMPLSDFAKISLLYLIRSIARTISAMLLILVVMMIIGEGLPNFRIFSRGEIVSSVMFIAMIAGLILGWWRELVGAILILGGFLSFMASEYIASGDTGMGLIFVLFPLAGALYLIYWWLTRQ
jgi:hypothetical protein